MNTTLRVLLINGIISIFLVVISMLAPRDAMVLPVMLLLVIQCGVNLLLGIISAFSKKAEVGHTIGFLLSGILPPLIGIGALFVMCSNMGRF